MRDISQKENNILYRALKMVYNATIREFLPKRFCIYGGPPHGAVPARNIPLLDMTDRLPNHKKGVISAIYDVVDEGDNATVVGGGMGVTSTHLVQAGASVVAYEAAGEMIPVARETWEIAGVQEQIDLQHRLVGEGIKINDGAIGKPLPPSNLSTGDVLLLDCEGAEKSILAGLRDWPTKVIVETHPAQGVPSSVSQELLNKQGYQIETREYEPGDDEKKVLVGHLQ